MASGYKVGGVDLDSIFQLLGAGTAAAATGYKVGTLDLNTRYLALSAGTAASATGYKVGTLDLNTFFAKIGSAPVGTATRPITVAITGIAANASTSVALTSFTGSISTDTSAWSNNGGSSWTVVGPASSVNTPFANAPAANDICFVSGAGANAFSYAEVNTSDSGQDMSPVFSTNGGQTLQAGTNVSTPNFEGAFSIASNGSQIVMMSTKVSASTGSTATSSSQSTGWTAQQNLTFQVGISGVKGTLKVVNGIFVALNATSAAPLWFFNATGTGAWTSSGTGTGSQGFLYDIAYSSTLGLYMTVGQTNVASGSNTYTGTNTTLTTGNQTSVSWPASTNSPKIVTCVLWVPSIARFIAADNKGNFCSSSNGTSWTQFAVVPATPGLPLQINCCCISGTNTLWGSATGYVITLPNASVP